MRLLDTTGLIRVNATCFTTRRPDAAARMPERGRFFGAARISRRGALAAGAAGVSACLLVAACGGSKPGATGTPTRTPRRGGTLRTGTTLPLAYGLDPQIETGTGLAVFPRVYGYLHHIDPNGDALLRDHVREIEQPDATTYIFRLRTDVRFHDTAPVNGRAVA